MSQLYDVFGTSGTMPAEPPMRRLGYPRNPFEEPSLEDLATAPLYTDYVQGELSRLQLWLQDVHEREHRTSLSLVGNIGAGKTRLLRMVERHVREQWPTAQKAVAVYLRLSDTGYRRASLGGLVVNALDLAKCRWTSNVPVGVIPLIWATVVSQPQTSLDDERPLGRTLDLIRAAQVEKRAEMAGLLSGWLRRSPLTPAQARRLGLPRSIDWEGELIPYLASLLRCAKRAGALQTLCLLLDQLEDLFTSDFSDLKRARLLTDLRALVDEIDAGAPLGLVLAWTPELGATDRNRHRGRDVQREFQRKYEALYSRMQRLRIDLPLLHREHAEGYARVWIGGLEGQHGFDPVRQPAVSELAEDAWKRLKQNGELYPGGGATPRDLLAALRIIVERRVSA